MQFGYGAVMSVWAGAQQSEHFCQGSFLAGQCDLLRLLLQSVFLFFFFYLE